LILTSKIIEAVLKVKLTKILILNQMEVNKVMYSEL